MEEPIPGVNKLGIAWEKTSSTRVYTYINLLLFHYQLNTYSAPILHLFCTYSAPILHLFCTYFRAFSTYLPPEESLRMLHRNSCLCAPLALTIADNAQNITNDSDKTVSRMR